MKIQFVAQMGKLTRTNALLGVIILKLLLKDFVEIVIAKLIIIQCVDKAEKVG